MKWLNPCLGLTLLLAGCTTSDAEVAAPAARAERDCFDSGQVGTVSFVDRDTVRLDAGSAGRYEADLSGPMCDQALWSQPLALEPGSSSRICTGDGAGQGAISYRDPATLQSVSCYIDRVRRVPDEAR